MPETHLRRAVEGLREAALDAGLWPEALTAVAAATNTETAQLIGFEPGRAALFNWWTGAQPGDLEELQAVGGNDPAINSRVWRGLATGEMVVLDETQFTTDLDRYLHPAYDAFVRKKRADVICLINLIKQPRAVVGFAVMRGPELGNLTAAEQATFALLARQARQSVRVMMRLRSKGAEERLRVLDACGTAAFVCDAQGRVLERTEAADALLVRDRRVKLVGDVIALRCDGEDRNLTAWVRRRVDRCDSEPIFVAGDADGPALVMDATPLTPADEPAGLGAAALIVVRSATLDEGVAERLRHMFALSPAESTVAVELLNGCSPDEVAARRGAGLGTVRAQVRGLYSKLGVDSQLRFAALMRAVLP